MTEMRLENVPGDARVPMGDLAPGDWALRMEEPIMVVVARGGNGRVLAIQFTAGGPLVVSCPHSEPVMKIDAPESMTMGWPAQG